jgi:hypothetical protein
LKLKKRWIKFGYSLGYFIKFEVIRILFNDLVEYCQKIAPLVSYNNVNRNFVIIIRTLSNKKITDVFSFLKRYDLSESNDFK